MRYISTRRGLGATSAESIFRGLAPDGGLYLPDLREAGGALAFDRCTTLRAAEEAVFAKLMDDIPEAVRTAAIDRLLSSFPAEDPVPLVDAGGLKLLELFHGGTGAFKDVALSMLPVLLRHSAAGRRVLVLTATSGDTGSSAMHGFSGVEGAHVAVFYPATGVSRIQRLQMTTAAGRNVHAFGLRGNFDDAQAAVKRMFADESLRREAEGLGVALSSANSINTGRLTPQIGYWVMAAARVGRPFDVVVPSGNFGNILAAYYAKLLGAPVRRLVCASNVNDVLARFVKTGVYAPGDAFRTTNSPSMDIRKSSNVERLLWILNGGDCAETARLMDEFAREGRYTLGGAAKKRLLEEFDGGMATEEETEDEMRRFLDETGYALDPHTAVAVRVARKLGLPEDGTPAVVAATATPFKFPETCRRAFGRDIPGEPPPSVANLESLPVLHDATIDVRETDGAARALLRRIAAQ